MSISESTSTTTTNSISYQFLDSAASESIEKPTDIGGAWNWNFASISTMRGVVVQPVKFDQIPEFERDVVEQTFDVDLLMQQVRNNALDILRLSDWLKNLLTAHCAPIRDTWAEKMSALLCDGARQGNTATLVAGLAKLFDLCEAMKLDISNHQIRSFRTLLIEDGISFQRDYFSTRVRNNKLDIASSHEWFACYEQSLLAKTSQIPEGLDVLVEGLAELCTVPGLGLPITLKHDTMRIRQIQEEIQDIVSLGICIVVFEHAVHRFTGLTADLSPMHGILKTRIMDLTDVQVDSEDNAADLWQGSTEVISIEVTRAVSSLAQRAKKAPDPNMQQYVARELVRCFQAEQSNQEHVSIFATDLKQRISDHATAFRKLSALDISEAQRQYQEKRQPKTSIRLLPDADDISRRLAHMIVIHWEARIGAIEQALHNAAALGATSNSQNGSLRIVSIDMGIRNLAYCTLQAQVPRAFSTSPDIIRLSAWQRVEVGNASSDPKKPATSIAEGLVKETFEPYEYAKHAYSLIKRIVDEHYPTHVLIERQRFRSGGGAAVQEWTIRVGVFEAMIYATLRTLAEQNCCNCTVASMAPVMVNRFWLQEEEQVENGPGHLGNVKRQKSTRTKQQKIRLLEGFLRKDMADGTRILFSNGARKTKEDFLARLDRTKGQGAANNVKLDDLADSLLQGLAWISWQRNRLNLESVAQKELGAYS
ncbi:hypothetical protein DV736_g466, partial [Chaetothyriales sp. CBS 134916]